MQEILETEVARVWAGQSDGAHDLGHLRRVWANCQLIADKSADMAVLQAAAFLHDIINVAKDAPNRAEASQLSADHAVRFLEATGFDAVKIPAVAHAIAAHSFSAGITPETLEAKILQDADRIEALGMIGLARWLYVSGAMGTQIFDPEDPMAENRPLDDRRFALDHLEVKLFRLVETMQTEAGRALAQSRADVMLKFREDLLAEAFPA